MKNDYLGFKAALPSTFWGVGSLTTIWREVGLFYFNYMPGNCNKSKIT
jgi:hypothetical protein